MAFAAIVTVYATASAMFLKSVFIDLLVAHNKLHNTDGVVVRTKWPGGFPIVFTMSTIIVSVLLFLVIKCCALRLERHSECFVPK